MSNDNDIWILQCTIILFEGAEENASDVISFSDKWYAWNWNNLYLLLRIHNHSYDTAFLKIAVTDTRNVSSHTYTLHNAQFVFRKVYKGILVVSHAGSAVPLNWFLDGSYESGKRNYNSCARVQEKDSLP